MVSYPESKLLAGTGFFALLFGNAIASGRHAVAFVSGAFLWLIGVAFAVDRRR